jgi:hypothetical protein
MLDRLLDLFELAKQVNVPIYTVDPHGLASPESVSNLGEIDSPGAREGLVRLIQARHDFLHTMASNTGGRAFVNQSDLKWAARQIVAENGSYYLLGYYPKPWVADGEFHPIDVKVKKPGLQVRARAGYKPPRTVPPSLRRPPRVTDSLQDGVAGGDLQLRAFAAPIAPARRGARAVLTLDVAYPEVLTSRPRPSDRLHIAWAALDPDARILGSGEETLQVPLAQTGTEAFTLSITQFIDVPARRVVLRVAALSEALSTTGVVHFSMDVPNFATDAVTVAPLVLATTTDRSVRVARLGSDAGLLPLQPTTRREFGASESIAVLVRGFADAPSDLTAELRLKRHGMLRRSEALTLRPVPGQRRGAEARVGIPLSGLEPGEWVIEVAVGPTGGRSAARGITFRIR